MTMTQDLKKKINLVYRAAAHSDSGIAPDSPLFAGILSLLEEVNRPGFAVAEIAPAGAAGAAEAADHVSISQAIEEMFPGCVFTVTITNQARD